MILFIQQILQTTTTTAISASKTDKTTKNIPIILNQTLLSENQSEDETILIAVPLLDYIINIMRFVQGVIINNTTNNHGKEFVKLNGLKPLLDILQMKSLTIDFSSSQGYQCVATSCKSTLTRLIKDNKLTEMIIINPNGILNSLIDLYSNHTYHGSLLIEQ